MEKYLGVKLIEAMVLSKDLYSYYQDSGNLPVVEDGIQLTESDESGYLVRYEDGYESWSPKDVFKNDYRKIKDRSNLSNRAILLDNPYAVRVFDECSELSDKIINLENFINQNGSNIYSSLDANEQTRLKQQLMAMQYYLTILVERIENF